MFERLKDLRNVQAPVADQFARQQEYRDLVSVAASDIGITIDIDDIHRICASLGHLGELSQKLLAQAAARAGV